MSTIFDQNGSDRCCLCGSPDKLTGEHKLKASALASRFKWDEALAIVSSKRQAKPKFAQSAKSKHFHYEAPVCEVCNTRDTQSADAAFSRLDAVAQSFVEGNEHPKLALRHRAFIAGSGGRVEVMRYFAKSLACAIAESKGPRFIHLTDFAIGRSDYEVVFLEIDIDPDFERWREEFNDNQYASHAGLDVSFSLKTGLAEDVRSSFTFGPVRYTFYMIMQPPLAEKLRLYAPEFYSHGERRAKNSGMQR